MKNFRLAVRGVLWSGILWSGNLLAKETIKFNNLEIDALAFYEGNKEIIDAEVLRIEALFKLSCLCNLLDPANKAVCDILETEKDSFREGAILRLLQADQPKVFPVNLCCEDKTEALFENEECVTLMDCNEVHVFGDDSNCECTIPSDKNES